MSRAWLRRCEWAAVAGTAVAFVLTVVLAGSGLAIESNGVVRAIVSRIGWAGAGVLAIGVEAAFFAGYRLTFERSPRASLAGGGLLAALGIGDVLVNLYFLSITGWPATYHWDKWLPVMGAVGGAALLVVWRPDPRALARRVPEPSPVHNRVAGAVAIACLMALSGVPPSAFGPGAPGETVESAMGAGTDEWIYVAEGNGDAEKTDGDTIDWTESVGANGVEGVSVGPNTDWVYAVDIDGTLERIDEADGTSDWTKSFDSTTHADVSAGPNGNWAYYTSASGNFLARVHASNGTDDWNVTMEHTARDVVAQRANSNWVYVADSSGGSTTSELKRIHANNGSTDWSYTAPEDFITAVDTSPDGDTVYATSQAEGEVHAVHESNGTQKWVANVATEQMDAVAAGVNGDFVYAAADDDGGNTFTFYKIHASNGTEALSTTKSALSEALAAGSQGTYIYAGRGSSDLVGVFTENGTDDWTQNLGTDVNHLSTSGYFDEGGTAGGEPPYVDSISPNDGEYLNTTNRSTNLNATLKDPESDPIDATIYWNPLNGSGWHQVASQTDVTSGNEINTTIDAKPGENWWKVETDDDVNAAANSTRFEFYVGDQVIVYNGSDYTLANDSTLTVNATSTVDNWRNDTQITNAKFDWIPGARHEHRVDISHPWKFKNTTITVEDPAEPTFVLLTPNSDNSTVSNWANAGKTHLQCFELDDGTGNFPPSDTVLRAKQYYDGEWRLADNDRFGADNNASLWLQDGETYRLSIKSDDGNVRSLNEFQADSSMSGCVTLVVESEDEDAVGPEDSDSVEEGTVNGTDVGYAWDAWRVENGTGLPYLKFEWELADSNTSTESFQLQIYEYQNKSNRTIYNNSFGSINSIEHRQDLNSSQENDTWVVQWNATIDGTKVNGSRVLGPQDIGPGLPVDQFWKELAALASVLIVGGLAGGTRAEAGAILAALTGGIFFMLGWLPAEIGGGIILAALTVGALYYAATEGEPT